jgi:hypothetical protein
MFSAPAAPAAYKHMRSAIPVFILIISSLSYQGIVLIYLAQDRVNMERPLKREVRPPITPMI